MIKKLKQSKRSKVNFKASIKSFKKKRSSLQDSWGIKTITMNWTTTILQCSTQDKVSETKLPLTLNKKLSHWPRISTHLAESKTRLVVKITTTTTVTIQSTHFTCRAKRSYQRQGRAGKDAAASSLHASLFQAGKRMKVKRERIISTRWANSSMSRYSRPVRLATLARHRTANCRWFVIWESSM